MHLGRFFISALAAAQAHEKLAGSACRSAHLGKILFRWHLAPSAFFM